jgi:hypothetical protein
VGRGEGGGGFDAVEEEDLVEWGDEEDAVTPVSRERDEGMGRPTWRWVGARRRASEFLVLMQLEMPLLPLRSSSSSSSSSSSVRLWSFQSKRCSAQYYSIAESPRITASPTVSVCLP